MKKYFITLLSVLLIAINVYSLFAESSGGDQNNVFDHSSATFEILGYKVNPEADLAFEITDALSESLAVIGSGASEAASAGYRNISIDNHIDQFLGDVNAVASDPRNQIIFSYRVTGRGNEQNSNTYRVDFRFLPFFRYVNDQQDTESYINASYQLVNRSYSFPDYTSDRNDSGTERIENDNRTSTDFVVVTNNDEAGKTLSSYWTVTGENAPLWIHRGAVTMTIDSSTTAGGYNNPNTKFGLYKATVTATLYAP